ncbi:MAG TPA: outer membrane beta-barrel protein [Cyclobacteriaceae bacterium]
MKLIYTILFLLLFLSKSFLSQAQEEEAESELILSGSVDAYFRQNLSTENEPQDGNSLLTVPATSFADKPGFALGMINLIAEYSKGNTGMVADLVFGQRGADAVFLSGAINNIVNQLYVFWDVSDNVTLTLGNFNTYLGYEVISPTGNYNYSTSYMFTNGPFSHTGIKADIALSDNFSLMLSLMNPTDQTDFNFGDSYVGGLQLGYENDAGGLWLNVRLGDEDGSIDPDKDPSGTSSGGVLFQTDITTGWDLSDSFYLGFNGTILSQDPGVTIINGSEEDIDGDNTGFAGSAIYLQNAFSDRFGLGLRYEYFTVINGDDAVDNPNFNAFTLSGNYKVQNLTIIPEFRVDLSNEDVFADSDFNPTGSLSSFLIAAVYEF